MDEETQNNQSASQEAPEQSAPRSSAGGGGSRAGKSLWRKPLMWIAVIIVLAVVVLAAAQQFLGFSVPGLTMLGSNLPEGAVAVVNGEEISQESLDARMTEQRRAAEASGQTLNDSDVRERVMRTLINEELVAQEAAAAGITASEEVVEEQYNSLVEQFENEEALLNELDKRGVTKDEALADIRRQSVVQQYVAQEVENRGGMQPTDQEIQAAYDQLASQAPEGQSVPPLSQVREQIAQRVQQQKFLAAVQTLIDSLRSDAEIIK